MYLTLAATLALATAALGSGNENAQLGAKIEAFRVCLLASATMLESSGASIDDIFEASRTKCAGQEISIHDHLIEYWRSHPEALGNREPYAEAERAINQLFASAKDRGRVLILTKRAQLKAQNK